MQLKSRVDDAAKATEMLPIRDRNWSRARKYHSVRNNGSPAVWIAEAFDDDDVVQTASFIGKDARQRCVTFCSLQFGLSTNTDERLL